MSRRVTTTAVATRDSAEQRRHSSDALVLVVVWSRDEPERTGECVVPPARGVAMLGRLGPDDAPDHLQLFRLRPGCEEPRGPLRTASISRTQLRIGRTGRNRLMIENVGRAALVVNGEPTAQAHVGKGDFVDVGARLLFVVVSRPRPWKETRAQTSGDAHPFGGPDEHGLVGESPAMWELRDRLALVATFDDHTLVTGASGAGKELVARAVHRLSTRRAGPLVARNAAAIPESLVDAELFGHARNYPNPGTPEREGVIGAASGGILLLDEIAELLPALQTRLLRVLDTDGEYHRLGEAAARHADVRLIGATNRPVSELREDVAARFVQRIHVPALADRADDVPLMLRHVFHRELERNPEAMRRFLDGDGAPRFGRTLVASLVISPPGDNARGIRRALMHAVAYATGRTLESIEFPHPVAAADMPLQDGDQDAAVVRRSWTPEEIQACLDRHDGVQGPTWRELGMRNRYQLQRLIRKHGLRVKRD